MKDRAYAKINLALNVKGERSDGYHELEMVMVPVSFYDEVEVTVSETMEYSCNRPYIRFDEKNTIVKAVEYLKKTYDIQDNFKVHLSKHIPTRAGLAGGSSDAASVIRLIDKMYHLNMTLEEKRKASLAVGADVLFCLVNEPAIVKGIGDILEPFEINTDFHILLVKPRKGVSTKDSFDRLDMKRADHPDVYALKKALEEGDYVSSLSHMSNSLEEPSFRLCPSILKLKKQLEETEVDYVLMSGSGSTVFALSQKEEVIDRVMEKMKKQKYFVRKVKIIK